MFRRMFWSSLSSRSVLDDLYGMRSPGTPLPIDHRKRNHGLFFRSRMCLRGAASLGEGHLRIQGALGVEPNVMWGEVCLGGSTLE